MSLFGDGTFDSSATDTPARSNPLQAFVAQSGIPLPVPMSNYSPLIPSLPSAQKAFTNKYTNYGPQIQASVPPYLFNALLEFDKARVARGQMPLSVQGQNETRQVLQSAVTGDTFTPQPKRKAGNVLGNALADIRDITTALPRLPGALFKEAKAIPSLGSEYRSAIEGGENPIAALARAPGVRLLPGSYTVGNVASGDISESLTHPVMSLLDILPIGKELGVGKRLGETAVGEAGRAVKSAVLQTRPGQALQEAFGQANKDLYGILGRNTEKVAQEANHASQFIGDPNDLLTHQARQMTSWSLRNELDPGESAYLWDTATLRNRTSPEYQALSPKHQAAIDDLEEIQNSAGEYAQVAGEMAAVDIAGVREFYTPDTGQKILTARARANIATQQQSVRALFDAELPAIKDYFPAIEQFLDETPSHLIKDSVVKSTLPNAQENTLKAYASALQSKGVDIGNILNRRGGWGTDIVPDGQRLGQFNRIGKAREALGSLVANLDTKLVNDRFYPYRNPSDVVELVKPFTKSPPFSKKFIDVETAFRRMKREPYNDELYRSANTALSELSRNAVLPIEKEVVATLRESIAYDRIRLRNLQKLGGTDKAVKQATTKLAEVESKAAPARYQELIDNAIEKRVRDAYYERFMDDPNWAAMDDIIKSRVYPVLSKFDDMDQHISARNIVGQASHDMAATWQEMKAAGYDPVFVHRTTPGTASALDYQRLHDYVPSIRQYKARTNDAAPYVKDIQAALNHQALELLQRRGMERAVDEIIALPYVKKGNEVIEDYIATAQRQLVHGDPESIRTRALDLARKDYVEWNPNSVIKWRAPSSRWQTEGATTDYWIPKSMKAGFDKLNNPPGLFSSVFDPIMRAFRTSVLALAPRWHAYNILGGGAIVTLEHGPQSLFNWNDARRLIKGEEVVRNGTKVTLPEEFRIIQGGEKKIHYSYDVARGSTLRRWMDESFMGKAKAAGATVIEKSFDFNQFFDDTYRAIAYLSDYDKAIKKGLTLEDATRAGMQSARKVLHTWDNFTPFERTIMRSVFPFYGFMSHMMKFATRFPYDHPFRTEVMASLTRNEIEDSGTGLPHRFLSSLFLGPMDSKGNVSTISLAGANPFQDTANLFTLAGFMGNVNPVVSTLLGQLGIDEATGFPELFPAVSYDSETGRLQYKSGNPIQSLIENTIPQTRLLSEMTGANQEFKELLRENPEAAHRLLLSQVGIPMIYRNTNIPTEIFKNQLNVNEAQSRELTAALKSGNDSEARRYPALGPLLDQIRAAQARGDLTSLNPLAAQQTAPV